MKRWNLLFLLLFIFLNFSHSQTTHIPDDVFEETLIELGYDNGPLDNYVNTSHLDKIIYLDLKGKNIQTLDGIENFLNLHTLVCDSSLLKKLKETKPNFFKKMEIRSNLIEALDTSNYTLSFNYNVLGISINKY
ncbi:MAG: hypothetical protein HKO92_01915 [Flavobacteriaceae bacterium]|nr:hypothetical protein [Flavobacteriaceae bacterium]